MDTLFIKGFVRDVIYTPCFTTNKFQVYDITDFDINKAPGSGLINLGTSENNLAYSKWVSPKRTRTYPFARIYDTYHLNLKKVTIIPIIKDEGAGTQNNDRINFITFSWMNLLNIYVILTWYEDAERKPNTTDRITNQILNAEYVTEKLLEVSQYQMSALHWNTTHFEKDFENVYMNAVESYKRISLSKDVKMHVPQNHILKLEKFKKDGSFCLENFKYATLPASHSAALRESVTVHELEALDQHAKGVFSIKNYLGGEYHLTADEIYWEDSKLVIQESKNSSKKTLPSKNDIKDGLFKLILFSNLTQVEIGGKTNVQFKVRLKLTGDFIGTLLLPNDRENINRFCNENQLTQSQQNTIELLNRESCENENLQVWITKYRYQE